MSQGRNGPPQDSIDSILLALSRRRSIDGVTLTHYFQRLDDEWSNGAREKVLHLLKSRDASAQNAALRILTELVTEDDLEELEEFVADPTISDIAKLILVPVLKMLDSELADDGILEYLNDPTSAMQQMQLRILELVNSNETGIEAILNDVVSMPTERKLSFVQWLGISNDERATSLLLPLLESQTNKIALPVIDALEQLGPIASGRAIPALNYLLNTSSNRILKQAARATLGRLTMQLIPGMENVAREETQPQALPYEAQVSFVDGSGTQLMMIAWRRPDDLLKIVNILYQDTWGIKDCYGLDEIDIEQWKRLIDTMNEKSFGCQLVPFSYARSLVADARAINKRTRRKVPIAYFVWRPLIESEGAGEHEGHTKYAERAERITAMLPAQKLDDATMDLARHGDELFSLDEFTSWMYEPLQAIEPYMNSYWEGLQEDKTPPKTKKKGKAHPKSQTVLMETLLDEALASKIDDSWRLRYETRLRRQAQLYALTNRDHDSRLALATAAMLHPNSHIAPQEQPFLRFMMRISIENGPLRLLAEATEALEPILEDPGFSVQDFFEE